MTVATWVCCAYCVYGQRVGPEKPPVLKCGIVLPLWVGGRLSSRRVTEDDGCSLGVMRGDPEWEAYLDDAAAEAQYGQQ